MRHLKKFEDSFYDEFPFVERPASPDSVPGFEDGTIDPYDDEEYEILGKKYKSGKQEYEKFLKIIKQRNFQETKEYITINIEGIVNDYCMSIYNYKEHIMKFLKEELIGKYIIEGFKNILTDETYQGIIEDVICLYINDFDCSMFFSLELKNQNIGNSYGLDISCNSTIKIDKMKTDSNKYNL